MNKPIFGTKEWASSNENIQFGCQHDCLYCYAKSMSIRHKKIDIDRWNKPILRQDKLDKKIGKRSGTTMFPTTHDLHPEQLPAIMSFIEKLLIPGNQILLVSKPHVEVIREICERFTRYKDQILFRFSIGSTDAETLQFWEPNAPTITERLCALSLAHSAGYQTSISAEPMLDDTIDDLIKRTKPYVTDAIWIGKMNDYQRRLKINRVDNQVSKEMLDRLSRWYNDQNINSLYERYSNDPLIKWKDSIKKVIGLKTPTEIGLDI